MCNILEYKVDGRTPKGEYLQNTTLDDAGNMIPAHNSYIYISKGHFRYIGGKCANKVFDMRNVNDKIIVVEGNTEIPALFYDESNVILIFQNKVFKNDIVEAFNEFPILKKLLWKIEIHVEEVPIN